jgi:hypothetical protein
MAQKMGLIQALNPRLGPCCGEGHWEDHSWERTCEGRGEATPLSFSITCAIIHDASPTVRTPTHPSPMQRQQQSKQYSCPTLSFDEIISNFFSWGFSISHEQLLRPSHEFVNSIYWICLNRVKDLSQDGLGDAVTATTALREHLVSLISQLQLRPDCSSAFQDLYVPAINRVVFLHHM